MEPLAQQPQMQGIIVSLKTNYYKHGDATVPFVPAIFSNTLFYLVSRCLTLSYLAFHLARRPILFIYLTIFFYLHYLFSIYVGLNSSSANVSFYTNTDYK